MNDPTIEVNIAEVLKDLQSGQKEILKEISTIKVASEEVKGEIKTVKIDLTWIKWLFGGLFSFIKHYSYCSI